MYGIVGEVCYWGVGGFFGLGFHPKVLLACNETCGPVSELCDTSPVALHVSPLYIPLRDVSL
jgi:hypothetical protein